MSKRLKSVFEESLNSLWMVSIEIVLALIIVVASFSAGEYLSAFLALGFIILMFGMSFAIELIADDVRRTLGKRISALICILTFFFFGIWLWQIEGYVYGTLSIAIAGIVACDAVSPIGSERKSSQKKKAKRARRPYGMKKMDVGSLTLLLIVAICIACAAGQ